MANLMPEVVREVHVGDTRRLSFQFLKSTRKEIRPLSNYGAEISFAYYDAPPHVIRACLVDGVNGIAIYQLQGDEYTQAGPLLAQFTVMVPDWYGGGASGRAFVRTSSPLIQLLVKRRPT